MKKILFIQDNLNIGGIQKSLLNLLKAMDENFDVSLMLFNRTGALLSEVPQNVKILNPNKSYSILGKTKSELSFFQYLLKCFFVILAKLTNRGFAMKVLGLFQKKYKEYDVVISYPHPMNSHIFLGGAAEFAIDKTIAKEKICFVHCDYVNSNTQSAYNDNLYCKFNKIACVSKSVKDRFVGQLEILKDKTYVQHNFYDLSIRNDDTLSPFADKNKCIIFVSISRLSVEKGLDRAIKALHLSGRKDILYYIVGGGPQEKELRQLVSDCNFINQVFFVKETPNPYSFMRHADYIVVPSRHEASPIVYDEAKILGVPIITTDTTSAYEVIGEEFGIICENNLDGLIQTFSSVKKTGMYSKCNLDNSLQKKEFLELL